MPMCTSVEAKKMDISSASVPKNDSHSTFPTLLRTPAAVPMAKRPVHLEPMKVALPREFDLRMPTLETLHPSTSSTESVDHDILTSDVNDSLEEDCMFSPTTCSPPRAPAQSPKLAAPPGVFEKLSAPPGLGAERDEQYQVASNALSTAASIGFQQSQHMAAYGAWLAAWNAHMFHYGATLPLNWPSPIAAAPPDLSPPDVASAARTRAAAAAVGKKKPAVTATQSSRLGNSGSSVAAAKLSGVAALDDATLLSSAVELACDSDGRELLESLVDRGSQAQLQTMVENLQGHILPLTLNEHGCRIVQKIMQVVSCDMQAKLFGKLSAGIVQCIEDKHGNFVVQACIEQLPPDAVRFVAKAVEGRVKSTCCHNYGCRVVQRLIEHCPTEQVAQIIDQAVGAAPELAKSQYGCHVLRCILERGRTEDKTRIFAAMRLSLSKLARSRFSSLVIEKCLEAANVAEPAVAQELQGEMTALVQTILAEPHSSGGEVPLAQMASTRFGRNILRKLLESTAEPERSELQRKLSQVRPSWETNAEFRLWHDKQTSR